MIYTGQIVWRDGIAAFRRFFGKDEVPPVSGIGISIDTESAKRSGAAKAFIRKIEFVA